MCVKSVAPAVGLHSCMPCMGAEAAAGEAVEGGESVRAIGKCEHSLSLRVQGA